MLLLRFFALALVSVACASKLDARQATNTNTAIRAIVDSLDSTMRHVGPAILTLQAQHKFSDITIGEEMLQLGAAFLKADVSLAKTPVSSGSTTASPTNDDISITYSDVMQLVSTSLSGVIGTGAVPHFPGMVAILDPIIANTSLQLNVTSPGSLVLVHRMMLDASQFLVDEGFNKTLAALGF
ncbi:POXA3b laccase small subunit [Mycena capillaripes]|nr:POXA3b laccase small subunit [Mycena capillaripes]